MNEFNPNEQNFVPTQNDYTERMNDDSVSQFSGSSEESKDFIVNNLSQESANAPISGDVYQQTTAYINNYEQPETVNINNYKPVEYSPIEPKKPIAKGIKIFALLMAAVILVTGSCLTGYLIGISRNPNSNTL